MSHLEELAAALVDNEMSHDQRDRAFVHLTDCGGCREEVEAQRRLKAMFASAPSPQPHPDLVTRLVAISTGVPTSPSADVVRAASAGSWQAGPAGSRPPTTAAAVPRPAPRPVARPAARPAARPVRRGPDRHARRVALGSASALAVACGLAVMLGGGDNSPPVQPVVPHLVREHTATTGNLPFNDPAGVVFTSQTR